MAKAIEQFERYLREALGIEVESEPWAVPGMPYYLRELYDVYLVKLLGCPYLLCVAKEGTEQTPATVSKHLKLLREKSNLEAIYLQSSITAYNRKRLIEHNIPFVVPGNQMYLPPIGLDLREHYKKKRTPVLHFSPSTQVVVIHALLRDFESQFNPQQLATRLGYSPMTMSRVFDELEVAGIDELCQFRHKRVLFFPKDKSALWEKVLPWMRNPVRKRIWTHCPDADLLGPRAGLSALAHYSNLASPAHPVIAVATKDERLHCQEGRLYALPSPEPGATLVEIWHYPPYALTDHGVIDPLSLYLSLRENKDERVEMALEEMRRNWGW